MSETERYVEIENDSDPETKSENEIDSVDDIRPVTV
jgi:hypothetical protein